MELREVAYSLRGAALSICSLVLSVGQHALHSSAQFLHRFALVKWFRAERALHLIAGTFGL